jgi:UDP-glucose 4-epimerase
MVVCLVTGGAGFVGSHLVEALLGQGHVVRVLDNLQTGNLDNLANVREKIELFYGDLASFDTTAKAMKDVQVVFLQGAPVVATPEGADPLVTRLAAASGTLNTLIAARDAHVRRVIYASSSSIYGHGHSAPLRENDPSQPLSPAAAATLAGEQDCVVFTYLYGLETVRLRYFNVYGPKQPVEGIDSEVARIVKSMVAGQNPVIYGDGTEPVDLIYVDDVVCANLLAAEAPRVAGRVYNIARGRGTTLLAVVEMLNNILGTRLSPVHVPLHFLDGPRGLADISSAQVDLGFVPATDLELGLRRCIEYHAAHPETPSGTALKPPHFLAPGRSTSPTASEQDAAKQRGTPG